MRHALKRDNRLNSRLKVILHELSLESHGNNISALLLRLPKELGPSNIMQGAKALDKYYVPTMCSNTWSGIFTQIEVTVSKYPTVIQKCLLIV